MKKLLSNIPRLLIVFSVFIYSSCTQQEKGWDYLIKSEKLEGWSQLNGTASYTYENGEIVGKTVLGSPNSFLCTDSIYSDFILEFEVKKDTILNSGVQIRSNSYPEYRDGRVHGYQVEIDNRVNRRYSGGIYDEARRGWLYNLSNNEEGRKAYNFGEWNKYRIEAIGSTIRVWVNGVPTANLWDDFTPSGFIGLQVHSVPDDPEMEGLEVRWRNIRIMTENLEEHQTAMELEMISTVNNLTYSEKENNWKLLFDGKSTEGWKGAYMDNFPEKGWMIEDGKLIVEKSGGAESQHGGDIVTEEQFSDFELQVDFKLTEGANSGIKYFVTLQEEGNQGSAFGLEFQILDDKGHPDAKKGREGNRTVGSLYDLITAEDKLVFPLGRWNHARVVAKGNHVEHWLNYDKVLEFERGSDEFRDLVAQSKYSAPQYNEHGRFGEAEKGHILLQDHGDRVSFKNIKIKIVE